MIVSQTDLMPASSRAGGGDQAKADLDYNSFLKLLIATMQNQDPTKPNDPAETLSQLAAFSSVEQNIKLNTKLDTLLAVSAAGQAASLIGRTVTSADGSISGIAASVELGSGGLVAILASGARLPLSGGTRIS